MGLGIVKSFLPIKNYFMFISLISGLIGSVLYMTQVIWDWFGADSIAKTLFSFACLIVLLFACASAYVGQKASRLTSPWKTMGRIMFFGFVTVTLLICIIGGFAMMLDSNFNEYAEANLGFLTGFRLLSNVTTTDLNALQNWATGIAMMIKALFLIVPFIIAVWGGLSVLTADSISDAEGGILAVVAAFIVVIIVWIFKLVEITLG